MLLLKNGFLEKIETWHVGLSCQYTHFMLFSSKSEHDTVAHQATLITSTLIEFSNHENIAVAYTNFLSIASYRIVNVRYRNDLLVTEIRVVVSYLSFINNIFLRK